MTNRITQAFRALLGVPHQLDEGTTLFGEISVPSSVKVFGEDRFRVVMLPSPDGEACDGCGRPMQALVLEFLGDEWEPLLAMHESKLPVMLSVLEEVARDLEAQTREQEALKN